MRCLFFYKYRKWLNQIGTRDILVEPGSDPVKKLNIKFYSSLELIYQISHAIFLSYLKDQFLRKVKFYFKTIFIGSGPGSASSPSSINGIFQKHLPLSKLLICKHIRIKGSSSGSARTTWIKSFVASSSLFGLFGLFKLINSGWASFFQRALVQCVVDQFHWNFNF